MHGFMISYEPSLLNELVYCDILETKILIVGSMLTNELWGDSDFKWSEGCILKFYENFDGFVKELFSY